METTTPHNYYEVKALSNTALGYLKRSAFHCHEFMQGNIKFDTNPMKLGRYLHAAVLEPGTITFEMVEDLRTKEGKATAQSLREKGITVLSKSEFDTYSGCINSLANNEQVKLCMQNAVCEQEFYFEYRGIACKMKPDIITEFEGKTLMIDLKFMVDANPEEFMRKGARTYDYDRQAAWYMNGYEIATGDKIDEFYFVCVEKAAPFCVSIIKVTPQQLKLGKEKYDHLVSIYLDTIHVGKFPAYEGIYEWGEEEIDNDFDMQSAPVTNFLDATDLINYRNIMAALKGATPIADTLANNLLLEGKAMINSSANKANALKLALSMQPKKPEQVRSYELAKKELQAYYNQLN